MVIITKRYIDDLTFKIIGCAISVHKHIGPGLLESIYHEWLKREFILRNIVFKTELWTPLQYKGTQLTTDLRVDFLVENLIVVELKAVEGVLPVHKAQILTYMKLLNKPKAVLLNFNCTNIFKEGQYTFVSDQYSLLPVT